jgi:hypothetical protein
MGTKNNPKNRVKNVEKKKFNDKEIEPIYYHGAHANHGNYMAAKYSGTFELVVDNEKKPIPWGDIK